jgi:hypothetical protein
MSKSKDKDLDELKEAVARLRTSYLNNKSRISELNAEINANEENVKSIMVELSRLPEHRKKGKKSELLRVLGTTKRLRKRLAEVTGLKNMTGRILLSSLKTLKQHSAAGQAAAAAAAVVVDDDDDHAAVKGNLDDEDSDSDSDSGAGVASQRTKLGCIDCRNGKQCARCKADERAARRVERSASLEDSGAGVFSRRASPRSSPSRSAAASNPGAAAAPVMAMAVAVQPSARRDSPSPKKGCWPWSRKKSNSSERSKSPSWWKKCFSRKNKDGNSPPTGGRKSKTARRQKKRGTLRK